MRRTAFVFLGLFALGASPALGAGYGLKEHSADAMAAAYAGAAATSSDASYLAYNPASLAGVMDTDFSISMVAILPGSKGTYASATTSAGNPTGGSLTPSGFISDALVPAFGFRHRLSDRIAVGLEISAPWGLRTDYPATWAGRYDAQKTELLTINATPTISYQLSPSLTFGAGLQVEYAQGTLTSAIDTGTLGALNGIPGSVPGGQDSFARLGGKSWTFGYTAGVMARPSDSLTLGLSYRSSLQHDLKGPLTFTLDATGVGATIRAVTGLFTDTRQTTPLTMPDMVEFGARNEFSSNWSGMVELDWTHWSRFRQLTVIAANPLQPNDVTTTHWRNTLFGSVGLEYRASQSLAFRAGAAYDQSPVPDATREPRIPDADRIWLSAGVRCRLSSSMDLNVTASRLFNLKTDVALNPAIPGAALRGTLTGTTQSYVNVAGLQLTYRP
ncbi:MAG TPA: outer membrane protein transport protein [Rhizomicrobium sp.]